MGKVKIYCAAFGHVSVRDRVASHALPAYDSVAPTHVPVPLSDLEKEDRPFHGPEALKGRL